MDKAKPVMRIRNGQVEGQQVEGFSERLGHLGSARLWGRHHSSTRGFGEPRQLTGGTVAVRGYGATHSWVFPTAEVLFRIEGDEWSETVVGVVPKSEGV